MGRVLIFVSDILRDDKIMFLFRVFVVNSVLLGDKVRVSIWLEK